MSTAATTQQVSLAYNLTTVNTLTSVLALVGVAYLLWTDGKNSIVQRTVVAGSVITLSLVYLGITVGSTVVTSSTPGSGSGVNPINLQKPCDIFVAADFYWNNIATPLFFITIIWCIFVLFNHTAASGTTLSSFES